MNETFNFAGLLGERTATLPGLFFVDFAEITGAFAPCPAFPALFSSTVVLGAERGVAAVGLRDFSVRGSERAGMSPRSCSLKINSTATTKTSVLHVAGHLLSSCFIESTKNGRHPVEW